MKIYLCILFLITSCSNHPTSTQDFDVARFSIVASSTIYNLNRTRPVDYAAKQPFRELEQLCSSYSFSPEEKKTNMMDILAQANYNDPMYADRTEADYAADKAEWDGVRVRQSRRNADFAYQMCMNAYREKHGMKSEPIKTGSNENYDAPNWNQ
ncbi:hypothetical protein U0129_19225 [Enterobacter hormaechei]|uniref:hypothetical protein n=1 Tax=Enterobacter hormaechei TaxID=158836 RepID=UPI0039C48676